MSDALRWLDQYDRVVAAAAQHLPDDVMAEIAGIAGDQRERRAYAGTVLLVGLAGGTGSGKSSLLNAFANDEVSPSGAIRPTTSEALAWVPADPLVPRLKGLFDRFGITDIVVHTLDPPIAIIDLPDVDSVDGRHRQIVAGLLPIIDLVVWVVDPEKYRDRVLHSEHLAPLAHHHERFRFVLNQVDRVDEDDVPVLVDDLADALVADGVRDPVIWVAAADPPSRSTVRGRGDLGGAHRRARLEGRERHRPGLGVETGTGPACVPTSERSGSDHAGTRSAELAAGLWAGWPEIGVDAGTEIVPDRVVRRRRPKSTPSSTSTPLIGSPTGDEVRGRSPFRRDSRAVSSGSSATPGDDSRPGRRAGSVAAANELDGRPGHALEPLEPAARRICCQ